MQLCSHLLLGFHEVAQRRFAVTAPIRASNTPELLGSDSGEKYRGERLKKWNIKRVIVGEHLRSKRCLLTFLLSPLPAIGSMTVQHSVRRTPGVPYNFNPEVH